MSISCALAMRLTVDETLETTTAPYINSSAAALNHNGVDKTVTLTASSTPAVDTVVAFKATLVAGAKTIDLTSITHNGATVSLSGKKIKAIKFRNPSANAMTITEGASNGYELLGNAFTFILLQNQELQIYLADGAPTVSGSLKNIDVSGTGTQYIDVIAVAGT